ncbi:gibberellin 2-beta-dioxygenase 8-like [Vicia villosa]|uniref:gibberellin 2-beta-dioxygenase 8-like n=1 Tax=Vicia villosa TaxID=3911 RepID=UPI00273B9CE5|nr:gibberellin 2-beta-dioxygenase 8-like [Vicia villosa]XP_058756509.1 gibberellin 2-beta-dioxygenase 8-like [Vicia villosa]
MDYEPPFLNTYKTLLEKGLEEDSKNDDDDLYSMVDRRYEEQLPLIDLERLNNKDEREECMKEISEAASEWGFFQVINHGISNEVMENMISEQMKLFREPFVNKLSAETVFNLSPNTYRWGNPCATKLRQLSWIEAFHFPLTDIPNMEPHITLRSSLEDFATRMATLGENLVEILAIKVNMNSNHFQENYLPKSSFIRLNRYPPCPISSKVYGILPHSDTSFLTILYQDQIGGLQLMKDGKWVDVKPNPSALVVNIGDLFQALSNNVYKSIKHRVVAAEEERFSTAFFYCPFNDAVIQSENKPALYKKFTLREYRQQTLKDVNQTGDKVGLSRFVL